MGMEEMEMSNACYSQMSMGESSRRNQYVGGTSLLNTITPCAACKLLRRRCVEECPFSPYFSPHEPHKFAAVHKVFGASNVSKMLMEVPENERADTANSLVYEANVRLRDPVYGCMGAILALQQQLQCLQSELHAVRTEILKHKYTQHQQQHNLAVTSSNNNILLMTPPPAPHIGANSTIAVSSTTSNYSSNVSTDNNVPY